MTANGAFTRPDGGNCPAYFAGPGEGAPALVVLQEWWGLNEQIQGVADRLAGAGYRVLAPDLYRGDVALEVAEAQHRMEMLDFVDAADQDIRGAVAMLRQSSPAVGVMGFCMGGALSMLAAARVPEVDAVSAWYGLPPANALDVERIAAAVQGHFGREDTIVPMERVDALEAALQARGHTCEIHRYQAGHAFGNENGANYEPEAAALAWQRTLDFFLRQLAGGA
ncbi:dienelactone hydrolase family protein [Ectothiorhodospiraceae bacterium WFHF3C12]|nr:dienelactone hydrolase family protein [Ectothiorhodospiraceae bacterium WFHF3C12]